MKDYCHYRHAHGGVSESTLVRDVETARGFLGQLQRRTKSIARATWQMWTGLCGRLPPGFRNERLPILAVRSERFSDFCT
jgi:hypothetical protein